MTVVIHLLAAVGLVTTAVATGYVAYVVYRDRKE